MDLKDYLARPVAKQNVEKIFGSSGALNTPLTRMRALKESKRDVNL